MERTPSGSLDLAGAFAVETPEQVAFRLERAGLGSRIIAAVVDGAILGALYVVSMVALFVLGLPLFTAAANESALWVVAAMIAVLTFLFWAYYIAFEGIWNGQTPGKRLVGIRVVGDDGTPVSLGQVVTRNLLRFVDFQLGYAVGIIAIFVTRDEKRIGDLAAGTVVVSERRSTPLSEVAPAASAAPPFAARHVDPHLLDLLKDWRERSGELDPKTRHRLADDLADRLARETGRPPAPPGRSEAWLAETARDLLRGSD